MLVHYLNVPAIEDCGKICGPVLCSINSDRKEWLKWSKEELVGQLKPMCERGGTRGRWAWAQEGQAESGRGCSAVRESCLDLLTEMYRTPCCWRLANQRTS